MLELLRVNDRFLILLARLSGIVFAPVFNTKTIPVIWKVSFILIMTVFAWKFGFSASYQVPEGLFAYVITLACEITTGLIISLTAQFFFAAIQLAGQLIDTQMGFGIMNVIDPLSGTQAPILGNFKFVLALLVYLNVNGHHLFIQALFDSYRIIPIGEMSLGTTFLQLLIQYFGNIFIIGLKLSLPIVGALLFADIILGIMARTVPQMNIFMVGMPAKILLGFGVLLASIPLFIYYLNSLIENMFFQIYHIIRSLV